MKDPTKVKFPVSIVSSACVSATQIFLSAAAASLKSRTVRLFENMAGQSCMEKWNDDDREIFNWPMGPGTGSSMADNARAKTLFSENYVN